VKAVLDTNAVISGLLTPQGVCAQIIDQMRMGTFELCIDGRIFAEYVDVLSRPELSIPGWARRDLLDFVRHRARRIDAPLSAIALPHENDMPFLEVALEANAALVTGNRRHFPAKACKGVRVVTPTEFLTLLRRMA
jgi:predicted nucleic acid-binding protein